jgi:hypothetical protein
MACAGQTGGQSRTTSVPESLSDFSRPWNKNTPKTQPARKENPTQSLAKQLQTDQELTKRTTTNNTRVEQFTRGKSHKWHTPVRPVTHTPVRPVKPGQLGMNSTRGSTPPNATLDLPNRCTDLHDTLGIVGTPHEDFISKFMTTKSCQIKRN